MYLLKFETDAGRLYLVNSKPNIQGLNLNLSKPVDSISFDRIKNLIENIETKFKETEAEKPALEKEEKPKEEKEEKPKEEKKEKPKEEKKKATIAAVIRQYVLTLKE